MSFLQPGYALSPFSFCVCFPVIISEPSVNLFLFWPGLHSALGSKGEGSEVLMSQPA